MARGAANVATTTGGVLEAPPVGRRSVPIRRVDLEKGMVKVEVLVFTEHAPRAKAGVPSPVVIPLVPEFMGPVMS